MTEQASISQSECCELFPPGGEPMIVGSSVTDPMESGLKLVSVNHPLYMLFAAATPGTHGEEAESNTP